MELARFNKKTMLYTYYLKVQSEEHFLYQKEIAVLWGIYTKTEKHIPYSALVGVILEEYQQIQGKRFPEFYYFSEQVPRAYPEEQYRPAMEWFMDRMRTLRFPTQYTFGNRNYNFILEPTAANGIDR